MCRGQGPKAARACKVVGPVKAKGGRKQGSTGCKGWHLEAGEGAETQATTQPTSSIFSCADESRCHLRL